MFQLLFFPLFKNLLIQFGNADQKENVQLVFTTMWMNKSFPVTPISPLSVAETHSDLEKSRSSDLKNKKKSFLFLLKLHKSSLIFEFM